MGKTVVILGGGSGGIAAANILRKNLKKEHRVILIDKNSYHYFAPSFLWYIFGSRTQDQVRRKIDVLKNKGIEYIKADISGIDIERKAVHTNVKDISYDYLIIALGAELDLDIIPGFNEAAYSFYNFEECVRLKDNLKNFSNGNVAVVISSMPFKCPAAPYEMAVLLDYYFKKNKK
ncbi:MAG: FAD-dependent oxidoreductase [bacterium]